MKHTLEILRRAHYHTQRPQKEVRSIVFVIHGYGQLANEFIEDFSFLKESSTLVVAPEAISKFYNKEKKAVANWMTSHERLDEIEDYINYLNQLEKEIQSVYGVLPTAILGFSQGVSTALRWICARRVKFNFFYACSGSIPPELHRSSFDGIRENQFFYYYGNADRLLTTENAKKQLQLLESFDLGIKAVAFEGRHEISQLTKDDLQQFSESY